ncbi:hypothetical protein [Bradyrhizobium guangdongense]|uniref:hypothetical protein n=1 Tax=Bradyrhizobium guangdongense TaxID=1325090 RepID=UPI0011271866|nr:hypothetical protein [Bradyrhizobium guangdongense]
MLLPNSLAFAQDAADRISTQLDLSRAQRESRYSTVGNQPKTETVVIPQRVIEPPAPRPSTGARPTAGFVAETARPKPKPRKPIVIPSQTVTVSKPAPTRINPY